MLWPAPIWPTIAPTVTRMPRIHAFPRSDTTNEITELSDYSVCTTWGRKARIFTCSTSIERKWIIRL